RSSGWRAASQGGPLSDLGLCEPLRKKRSRPCRSRLLSFDVRVKRANISGHGRPEAPLSTRRTTMKFLVLVKANKASEAGVLPDEKLLSAMGKYNEELVKAGVLLDLAGLHPSSKGARVRFSGDKRTVLDGPFPETKELIAGYWLIQVKSKEEAIEWIKRCP